MKGYKTVVWATDGSDGADAALEQALGHAELTGAHVVAVHCDQRMVGRAAGWPVQADEEDILLRIRHQVAELKEEGLDIELVVRHSHTEPADVVATVAAEHGADVIVCGTRGLGALGQLFLGSFTQRLLRLAPCPVLAVPSRPAVRERTARETSEVGA